ncbi:MAG: 16S rRNA (adenine(1518)-N(6)/adenine(1519)-N(6))-dimethyltransferase RsmA [bacterium]
MILESYSIHPRRDAGQNFLLDENVARRIVDASKAGPGTVVEIGPGLGMLTEYLLERADPVVGIEVDGRLCKFLSERFKEASNLILINADFLGLDIEQLSEYGGKFKVVSNLPYSISKPAISKILNLRDCVESAVLTVQQEVARRILASAGTREYGVMTVMVAYWARAESLFNVGSRSFFPSPKVNSTTIRLTLHHYPPLKACDERLFRSVVKGAFSQRRKMLKNSLAASIKLDTDKVSVLEKESGIDLKRRGETLSVREFVHLTNTLSGL